jgi:general secretion pathway protein C
MNLPAALLQWKERPLSHWVAAGNRVLPPTVSAVLVVAIAYQAARLTWLAVPSAPIEATLPTLAPSSGPAGQPSQVSLDASPIVDAHLFGVAEADPAAAAAVLESVVDAPETTLSLELTAVFTGETGDTGLAIIAATRGEERPYAVGETIDSTGGATLHAVYEDRVLLNRAGRLETLSLPKEVAATAARRPIQQRPVARQAPETIRQIISDNAAGLTDVIRVAPYIDQGQMVGFRLNPAQNRAVFDSLGLQPNDIVTDINGTALTDPASGFQVFESLGEATMANVTVIRNGTPEVLVIDTTQLQQLAEGRQ